jgi:hypothetical protein
MRTTFRRSHCPSGQVEERVPIDQAGAVIAGLSVLSWGVVILLVIAVRAIT